MSTALKRICRAHVDRERQDVLAALAVDLEVTTCPVDVIQAQAGSLASPQAQPHRLSSSTRPAWAHTFAVAGSGTRKDSILVAPTETVSVDVQADNPGQWMIHCHNACHLEAGMAHGPVLRVLRLL